MADMQLVSENTGMPIEVGTEVTTFRGEVYTLAGWTPPHTYSSSGRVMLKRPCGHSADDHRAIHWCQGEDRNEYYPTVIGAKIIEVAA
jgi:hypothetical protein